ncbi:HAD family hydrolase [Pseudonocardia ailaonensis]|uniref:HAD family hydrolase n=1 Tax=Pseudonocardia ailaonensis TaxID=367279 RepID=UPI0031D549E3
MWTPRLIALDIDGTTVHAHQPPSPRVLAAIRAVGRHAMVMLCTGRTVLGVRRVLDELGLDSGLTVCSNGAVVMDTASRVVREVVTFDAAVAHATVKDVLPEAVFGTEHVGVGQRVTGPFPGVHLAGEVTEVSEAELLAAATPKLIAYWPGGTVDEVAERFAGIEVPGATVTFDHEFPWVTMVAAGVSKASALAGVAAGAGVAQQDVLAVGDGDNDCTMLRWAGHGVAMGQAPPEVKEAADEVTGAVTEDGLAAVLERFS